MRNEPRQESFLCEIPRLTQTCNKAKYRDAILGHKYQIWQPETNSNNIYSEIANLKKEERFKPT